jgi:predicted enzyme related to lactoylglutathione lyase
MAEYGIGITGLAQVALSVKDLEAATAFYRDVLGLPVLFSAPPGLAFFQVGPTRLMLTSSGDGEVGSHGILYYAVADMQAAFAAVVGRGAAAKEPPRMIAKVGGREVWLAAIEDPDGHVVGLMSER